MEGHGQDPKADGARTGLDVPALNEALAKAGINASLVSVAPAPAHAVGEASHVASVAYDFVRYYVEGTTGCRNCGGLPHSTECFVGRFVVALALDYNERAR